MGELFGLVAKFDVGAICCESKDAFDVMHNLVETPLEVSCDECVHEDSSIPNSNYVILNSLDHSHISTICSQPSSFPEFNFDVPIDNSTICNSNVDLDYEDNVFDMLGGNVANSLSLGYFSGCDALLTHIAYT